jgi:hypothetical protein
MRLSAARAISRIVREISLAFSGTRDVLLGKEIKSRMIISNCFCATKTCLTEARLLVGRLSVQSRGSVLMNWIVWIDHVRPQCSANCLVLGYLDT